MEFAEQFRSVIVAPDFSDPRSVDRPVDTGRYPMLRGD
jgi:hypothetical protein